MCLKHRLFVSALKCEFFAREIKCCGRIISEDGYRMVPANVQGLKDMADPQTADEVCQFVHCCRWMAISIPDFARRVAPLVAVLEEAYTRSGRRTKRSIRGIQLRTLSWGAEHQRAFTDLQNSLRDAVKLAYPKPGRVLCVYTDASDRFWSGIVTQTDVESLKLPIEEHQHEPVALLGAEFKGAEGYWSTFEKEGFAIFQTFEKLDYLFLDESPVHVHTDHRNLLFIFAPLALEPAMGMHVVSKVQLWAIFLSRVDYSIEHIEGHRKIFTDILTRWTRGYRNERLSTRSICSILLASKQIVPAASDIDWPGLEELRTAQRRAQDKPRNATAGSDGLLRRGGLIWIPPANSELKLRILVVSHCGSMGHQERNATLSVVREDFDWDGVAGDVTALVRGRLHCLVTRTGERVPRPLGHAMHGDRPKEVVHLDFLFMGESSEHERYLLILRDDVSGYVWLWPSEHASSEAAAEALATWMTSFGAMEWIVSDQGPTLRTG